MNTSSLTSLLRLALTCHFTLTVAFAGHLEFDSSGGAPRGLAHDGQFLYNVDRSTDKLYRIDPTDGAIVRVFNLPANNPNGLTHGGGSLWVSYGTTIRRLSPDTGAQLDSISIDDDGQTALRGLAFRPSGNTTKRLFAASRHRIFKVNHETGEAELFTNALTNGADPDKAAFNGLGIEGDRLYAMFDNGVTGWRLYKLRLDNGNVEASYPIPAGGYRGLTVRDGEAWVADTSADRLVRFIPSTTYSDSLYIVPKRFPVEAPDGTTMELPYHSNHSFDEPNANIERVVVFQHGLGDPGDKYYARAVRAARRTGMEGRTLVIAMQLIDSDVLNTDEVPNNFLYWSGNRFWGYKSSSSQLARVSSFAALDQMFEAITGDEDLFPNLTDIVVSGHSGGGQFTNRYAATNNFEDTLAESRPEIAMHYAVMNPGNYLYMDAKRSAARLNALKIPSTNPLMEFTFPLLPWVTYDGYGRGLTNLNSYALLAGDAEDIRDRYQTRAVTYLIGDKDVESKDLPSGPADAMQGAHRLDRARIYFDHLENVYGDSINDTQSIIEIPDVGHSGWGMISANAGLTAVFGHSDPEAAVEISESSGVYTSARQVGLSCERADAEIRYTLDGSIPQPTSTLYTSIIHLNTTGTYTLKAKAFFTDTSPTLTAVAAYTIATQPAAPTVTLSARICELNASEVTITGAPQGGTIHYTLDGTEPDAASTVYESPFFLPVGYHTLKARTLFPGATPGHITTRKHLIINPITFSLQDMPLAQVPIRYLTILCPGLDPAAQILFTLDGSEPNQFDTRYAKRIALPQGGVTVKARVFILPESHAALNPAKSPAYTFAVKNRAKTLAKPFASKMPLTKNPNALKSLLQVKKRAMGQLAGDTPQAGEPVVLQVDAETLRQSRGRVFRIEHGEPDSAFAWLAYSTDLQHWEAVNSLPSDWSVEVSNSGSQQVTTITAPEQLTGPFFVRLHTTQLD